MREPIDALRSLRLYVALALLADDPGWEVRFAYEEGTWRRPFCRVDDAGPAIANGPAHTTEYLQPFGLTLHPRETEGADEARLAAGRIQGLLDGAFRRGAVALTSPPAPALEPLAGGALAGPHDYRLAAVSRRGESDPGPPTTITASSVRVRWLGTPLDAPGVAVYRDDALVARVAASDGEWVDDGSVTPGATYAPHGTLGAPMRVPLWDWTGVPLDIERGARAESDYLRVRDYQSRVIADPDDPLLLAVVADVRLAWSAPGPAREGATLQGVTLTP